MKKFKGRILVVDDESIIRESISKVLAPENYDVCELSNGSEAIGELKSKQFDILITDLKMPLMDGVEVMQRLSEIDPDLSMIMLTAYGSVDSARRAMKLGAVDYLEKPFTPEQLVEIIDKIMADRRVRLESRYRDETFSELKEAIKSTLNLDQVLDLIAQGLVKTVKAKGAAISLIQEKNGNMLILVRYGLSKELADNLGMDQNSLVAKELLQGKDVVVNDCREDKRLEASKALLRDNIQSAVFLPLLIRNRVIGSMMVFYDTPREFSDKEMRFFHEFCEQVALAIENSRTFQDLKDEYENLREDIWESYDKGALL